MRVRPFAALGALLAALLGLAVAAAPAASAHPLGNFSVNHYSGLRVEPDRVVVDYVVDIAEIPTRQLLNRYDANGDGVTSPAERAPIAARECAARAGELSLTVDGRPLALAVTAAAPSSAAGAAGLELLRITCTLDSATVASTSGHLVFHDGSFPDRVGWKEVTAVGDGTTLVGSSVPVLSTSRRLTAYPQDLLTTPLRVRDATAIVRDGGPRLATDGSRQSEIASVLPQKVGRVTTWLSNLVGHPQLTLAVGLLAVLGSVLAGALHAISPGHGKTVMAAYLVGESGRPRQAAVLGGLVTVTHTIGVLLLGLAVTATSVASERLIPVLEVVAGVLLVAVGVRLLRRAVRRKDPLLRAHPHDHGDHGHDHPEDHDHDHGDHGHLDDHDHDHPHGAHDHQGREPELVGVGALAVAFDAGPGALAVPAPALVPSPTETAEVEHDHGGLGPHRHVLPAPGVRLRWADIAAMGVAGGLVPSPSALIVLLGATALGRAWFGVVLVVSYGAGMAATLTGTGLLLLRVRRGLDRGQRSRLLRLPSPARLLLARLPLVTAGVIVILGTVFAARGVDLAVRLH